MSKFRFVGVVLLASIVAIVASQGVEMFINRVLRSDAEALTWIGDLVAGTGFMVMTSLWLKLRQTQNVLSVMERERVVLNTQLSIAAETYANAGHPAGLLLNQGGVRALSVGGPPVGLLPGRSYEQESISLSSGDLAVFVSDGVTEALDATGVEGPQKLANEVRRASDLAPGPVCARLLRAARHAGGPRGIEDWADDRTVVVFSVGPRPFEHARRGRSASAESLIETRVSQGAA